MNIHILKIKKYFGMGVSIFIFMHGFLSCVNNRSGRQDNQVAMVNGELMTVDEMAFFILQNRAATYNYFSQKYSIREK